MAEGRIPWNSIVRYGLYNGYSRDIIDAMVQVIKPLDVAYLAWSEKNKPK